MIFLHEVQLQILQASLKKEIVIDLTCLYKVSVCDVCSDKFQKEILKESRFQSSTKKLGNVCRQWAKNNMSGIAMQLPISCNERRLLQYSWIHVGLCCFVVVWLWRLK